MSYRIAFDVEYPGADFTVPADGSVSDAVQRFWGHGPIKLFVGDRVERALEFLEEIDVFVAEHVWMVYRKAPGGQWLEIAEPHADVETLRRALRGTT